MGIEFCFNIFDTVEIPRELMHAGYDKIEDMAREEVCKEHNFDLLKALDHPFCLPKEDRKIRKIVDSEILNITEKAENAFLNDINTLAENLYKYRKYIRLPSYDKIEAFRKIDYLLRTKINALHQARDQCEAAKTTRTFSQIAAESLKVSH